MYPLKRHEVSVHNFKAFGETHSVRQEVSGHDFSRAVRDPDLKWASAPAEALPNARRSYGSRSLSKKGLPDFKPGSPFLDSAVQLTRSESGGRSEEHTSELQSRQYLVC